MKQTFIHLSDLHFRPEWPEQVGLVCSRFIEDLKSELDKHKHPDPYLVFSGDLVQSAAEAGIYEQFMERIAGPLDKMGLGKSRRISVPGNHDVSRVALKPRVKATRGALAALDDEESFLNELPALSKDVFDAKFEPYKAAETQFAEITCCASKVGGAGWELKNNLGVYCLNTALCSFAGLEDPKTGEKINDKGLLALDTRSLYQWEQESQSKLNVLVMHHPLDWLTEWARTELEKVIARKFDLVLFGHFHVGVSTLVSSGKNGSVFSMSPALFTRKSDTLGYSIITCDADNESTEVAYRQWASNNSFVNGTVIAGDDSGRRVFYKPRLGAENQQVMVESCARPSGTSAILEAEFLEASTCCSSKRQVWVERDLSAQPETCQEAAKEKGITCVDLVENLRSSVIRAPKGFGLSCLGARIALEYDRKHGGKKTAVLCDTQQIDAHPRGVIKYVKERCAELQIAAESIAGLILDNWENSQKPLKVLRLIKEHYPNVPIVVLQGFDDFCDIQNASVLTKTEGFEMWFLRSLDKGRIRQLVKSYLDESRCSTDPDRVTNKLVEDIDALNMHRTPLNCLLLLRLLERAFDDSPVNRTQMVGNVLFSLFHDFDKIPTYSIRPDLKDCERALGYLSEFLLKNGRRSFTKADFTGQLLGFCSRQFIDLDVEVLFNFLCTENILIRRGIDFGFRHAYWFFYFVAQRMLHSKQFAEFMLSELRYTAFPEVIEFYTGLDRAREDAVRVVTRDLKVIDEQFLARTQIDADFNPFAHATWNPSSAAVERMHQEVADSIQESSLPAEVKDAVADGSYDRSKPYHQEVQNFITQSSLNQLVHATKSAARALRNSDYVDPPLRIELLKAVLNSWKRMCQILALLSPVLALSRKAQFDGMGFILDQGFDHAKEPYQVWRMVMTAIVDNVVTWYEGDLFSRKLAPLFKEHAIKNRGDLTEALLFLMLVRQRPGDWDKAIEGFIVNSKKNSFYLQKVYACLRHEFRFGYAAEHSRQQIRRLAAMAVAKHSTGAKHPNQALVAKAAKIFDIGIARESEGEIAAESPES